MKTLVLILLSISAFACTRHEQSEFIAINQVGYPLNGEKQAFLVNMITNSFELVRVSDMKVVFMKMAEAQQTPDLASGDQITLLDFSEFSEPGYYFIQVNEPKKMRSEVFSIQRFPYKKASLAAIQSYYYHRCGTQVDNGSGWGYKICHTEDARYYGKEESKIQATGGWHDAGDYNKFSVNTALSASLLLYLFEADPQGFSDGDLLIPENQNGIPDILDETKWALDWLLKMQHSSGGVYHKISQKKWIGEYLPHNDPSIRYLFDVSSAATASFAATSSLASRLFSEYDAAYANELKEAALKAWEYLKREPVNVPLGGFKNPPDVRGGEYGDPQDDEERMWAALELYKLTGEEEFIEYVMQNYWKISGSKINPLSWRNAEIFVLSGILKTDMGESYQKQQDNALLNLVKHADGLLTIGQKNGYKNLNSHIEYYWGSNSVGLANAFTLIQAYEVTGDPEYLAGAEDQLHFVLGRNPVNRSQVTGVGSRAVEHPYHQLSELDGVQAPIPGMLVGGPNNHLLLNDRMISPHPAKNYEDAFKNYLVNEPAINFTAIFAFVSGYLSMETTSITLTSTFYDRS